MALKMTHKQHQLLFSVPLVVAFMSSTTVALSRVKLSVCCLWIKFHNAQFPSIVDVHTNQLARKQVTGNENQWLAGKEISDWQWSQWLVRKPVTGNEASGWWGNQWLAMKPVTGWQGNQWLAMKPVTGEETSDWQWSQWLVKKPVTGNEAND